MQSNPSPPPETPHNKPEDENNFSKPVNAYSVYAKYSSLGIQIIFIVLVFVVLGQYLDGYFKTKKAFFTAGLSIVGCIGAMVYLIKAVGSTPKTKNTK